MNTLTHHHSLSPFTEYAEQYTKSGYSVIPITFGAKGPPLIREWQKFCDERPDIELVRDWIDQFPEANIGLCLGKASGLIALDYDYHENLHSILKAKLPRSPVGKIGAKGITYFYRYSGQQSKSWSKDGKPVLELLSTGKYTLIPPSIHPTGAEYEWSGGSKCS